MRCCAQAEADVVCPGPIDETVIIQAPVVEQYDSVIRASGGILFRQGTKVITASQGEYNTATRLGELRNVTFTTCGCPRPDYRFEARELALLQGNRIRARKVAFHLGGTRVLALPVFVMRTGRGRVSDNVFPRPSYDKDDGFGLAQEFRMAETDRLHAFADLAVTQKRGLEGEVYDEYALDGDLRAFPGKFLTYDSLASSALRMPRLPVGAQLCPEELDMAGAARLRQYGRLTIKQRTYDVRNTGLTVSRQPEFGLTYIAPAVNLPRTPLDPRLHLYPQVTASWGRFKETPSAEDVVVRRGLEATVAANLLPLGRYTAIQPALLYGMFDYGNGDSYRTWGVALDASRVFPNGATVTARYIRRGDSGQSPFVFDTVEMFRELQAAFQVPIGRHILGFATGFNGDVGRSYDWQLLYGYRTDCLAMWVTWHSLLQRLSVDAAIINL